MKPKLPRIVLVAAAAAAVAALAALDERPTSDAAPQRVEAQGSTAEEPLPDFRPSEQLPADSAVAFPTDI